MPVKKRRKRRNKYYDAIPYVVMAAFFVGVTTYGVIQYRNKLILDKLLDTLIDSEVDPKSGKPNYDIVHADLAGNVIVVKPRESDEDLSKIPDTYTKLGGKEDGFRVEMPGRILLNSIGQKYTRTNDRNVDLQAFVMAVSGVGKTETDEDLFRDLAGRRSDVDFEGYLTLPFHGAKIIEAKGMQNVTSSTGIKEKRQIVYFFAVKNGKQFELYVVSKSDPIPLQILKRIRDSFEIL